MNASENLLINRVWSQTDNNRVLRNIALVGLAVIALIISAKTKVDLGIYPPFTMQTAVILFIGASMGSRLGVASVMSYLALGASGAAVFAGTPEKGIGWAYMMGPTGGYLVGFVFAVILVGFLAERGLFRNPLALLPALLIASLVMLLSGFSYLSVFLGSAEKAWEFGVQPFLILEIVKAIAVSALLIVLGFVMAPKDEDIDLDADL